MKLIIKIKQEKKLNEKGFTIVELMVATVVFSVVLLVLTFGVIEMSNTYFKGINVTKAQTVSRNVMDDISRTIKFSGGRVGLTPASVSPGTTYAFCLGNRAYYYQLGYELKSGQAKHGLVVVDNDSDCPNNLSGYDLKNGIIPAGGQEMLSSYMRLTRLEVTLVSGTQDLYSINLQVTYGDDDLLTNPTAANGTSTHCKGGVDQQFCATSELYSTVEKRVN